MSWQAAVEPKCEELVEETSAIETVIVPRARDLGGFEVRRALPSSRRQMVGPFIFFDQMGPAEFLLGAGIDVRPHPHIGLATVTYLIDGEIIHRDSLGTLQAIRPGEVNWMTAGRGIAHSERTAPEARVGGARLFGIQTWVALPKARRGDRARLRPPRHGRPAAGRGPWHERAPDPGLALRAHLAGPDLLRDVLCGRRARGRRRLPLDASHEERGIYIVSGTIEVAGERFGEAQLLVFRPGDPITVTARTPARLMLLGGEPMDGPRHIWWNFVSSSKDRIDQAKADWQAGRFTPVPGDLEFIPLPE